MSTETRIPHAGTTASAPQELATTPTPAVPTAPAAPVAGDTAVAPVNPQNTTVNVHLPVNFAPNINNTAMATGGAAAAGAGIFTFDGGAADYLGIQILSTLLIVCTLGLATPWAVCMRYRWRAEHTLVNGRRLRFTGRGSQLAGDWFVTLLLIFVTAGIYSFWVAPRFTRFEVEHQVLV